MDYPETPMNYLLRAWVMADGQKKSGDASKIYKRMLDIASDNSRAASLHGFALLFAGKKAEALKWAEETLRDNRDTDGSVSYTIACLYAQAGHHDGWRN